MSVLEQLLEEVQAIKGQRTTGAGFKHTIPAGTHSSPTVHGQNSLFGVPGIERDVISSRVTSTGLAGLLPAIGSNVDLPLFAYMTGKTAASGSQPASECDAAPAAGNLKSCLQTAQFGIYQFRTRELQLNKIGRVVNAGETTDLRFVNDPLAMQLGQIFPNVDTRNALRLGREVLTRLVEVGMEFQETLSVQLYTASGIGNEFPGLELLVVKNHYDAKTGQVCYALESDVRDFGDVDITTVAGSASIVSTLVSIYRNAKHNAMTMGFNPVEFVWVMRPQMFVEVTDIWPCQYLTTRCLPANANVSIDINTDNQVRMRDEMQAGSYLVIDGQRIPVVQDAWMPEEDLGSNQFSSDIYLLPLSVRGGYQTLYWEYVDYAEGFTQGLVDGRMTDEFWTDGGKYAWVKEKTNWCTVWQSKIEPRIILRTPMLAARLLNVVVSLNQHWRSPLPGDAYYLNGGNSTGYPPDSLYNEWNSTP